MKVSDCNIIDLPKIGEHKRKFNLCRIDAARSISDRACLRPMMRIPFLELKRTYFEPKDKFNAAWHRVMDSGWYLLGSQLEAFGKEWNARRKTIARYYLNELQKFSATS